MITAALFAIASLSAPVATPTYGPAYGYASDTVRHSKGHPTLPVAARAQDKAAETVCHPDPGKGRSCRHHQAQAASEAAPTLATAETHAVSAAARPQ